MLFDVLTADELAFIDELDRGRPGSGYGRIFRSGDPEGFQSAFAEWRLERSAVTYRVELPFRRTEYCTIEYVGVEADSPAAAVSQVAGIPTGRDFHEKWYDYDGGDVMLSDSYTVICESSGKRHEVSRHDIPLLAELTE